MSRQHNIFIHKNVALDFVAAGAVGVPVIMCIYILFFYTFIFLYFIFLLFFYLETVFLHQYPKYGYP